MTDDVIATSTAESIIHAPLPAISLSDWVFTLTDSAYQACSKNHIAAAATSTPEGKRLTINVEQVGNLMVHHYVEHVSGRNSCTLISLSQSIGPDIGSVVPVTVVWVLSSAAVDTTTTRFINSVEVHATAAYIEDLKNQGVALDTARAAAQRALNAHNAEETPLFAKDIEQKALSRLWG
jgi:hypothetical protein